MPFDRIENDKVFYLCDGGCGARLQRGRGLYQGNHVPELGKTLCGGCFPLSPFEVGPKREEELQRLRLLLASRGKLWPNQICSTPSNAKQRRTSRLTKQAANAPAPTAHPPPPGDAVDVLFFETRVRRGIAVRQCRQRSCGNAEQLGGIGAELEGWPQQGTERIAIGVA